VTDKTKPQTPAGERIAKFLARAGIASRREVERMIEDGRVKVNGKQLDTPAFKVTGKEKIEVDGKPVEAAEPTKLWRYHKPSGLVTTHADPEGRTTVFDRLPKDMGRVISIGRLDLTSEGLLLLTNDGGLARALELPSTSWNRKYRVRAWGRIDQATIDKLKKGVSVEGVNYGPMDVEVENDKGTNIWLTIGIREGKNREIRRVLETVGLQVNRLIRIAYGPFQLGDMPPGEIKLIPARILKDQCGHLLDDETVYGDSEPSKKPTGNRGRSKPKSQQFGGPGQPGRARSEEEDELAERGKTNPKPAGAKPARNHPGKPKTFLEDAGAGTGRARGGKPGTKPRPAGKSSGSKSHGGKPYGNKSRDDRHSDADKPSPDINPWANPNARPKGATKSDGKPASGKSRAPSRRPASNKPSGGRR
jgi:23S rRNA pseudouridine2605 synthase